MEPPLELSRSSPIPGREWIDSSTLFHHRILCGMCYGPFLTSTSRGPPPYLFLFLWATRYPACSSKSPSCPTRFHGCRTEIFGKSTPGVSSATNHQQGVLRSWQLESLLLLAAHALLWVRHYIVEGNELNFIDIVPWRECLSNERAHLDTFVGLRLEPEYLTRCW